ncbi:histidine phosphatase superfamily protein [Tanacetum coccineum]
MNVYNIFRCLQTASEVVHAICALGDDSVTHMSSADGLWFDIMKCYRSLWSMDFVEALNTLTIQPENVPKDGDFGFDISECEILLPKGIVDSSVEQVYKELPKWEESKEGARDTYKNIIKLLADKYPTENLVLVTHGVWVSATSYTPEHLTVHAIDYCAYSVLQRTIVSTINESITSGEFKLCRNQGHTGVVTRPSAQPAHDTVKELESPTL